MHGRAYPSSTTLPPDDTIGVPRRRASMEFSGAAQRSPTRSDNDQALATTHVDDPNDPLYHSFVCCEREFRVEKRWNLIRELGQGAYGIVVSAQDKVCGETVAIKMVTRVFDKIVFAKRALREITLLRHFAGHENITGLIDMDVISPDFNEIYLFLEPMEADLQQIILSGQELSLVHVQYFLYQILRGMKYIHSANVVHRDIKPGNLLVNANCELKICDFGLSRGFNARVDENVTHMTEYVATRWYRSPEVMLSYKRYSFSIDVWSIGCVFGELLLGRPVFRGRDYVDQLNRIFNILGTPIESLMSKIPSVRAQAYVRGLPFKKPIPMSKVFPTAGNHGHDILERFLRFDPDDRITVTEALAHPFLVAFHDEADEPVCANTFEKWQHLDQLHTLEEYRAEIWREVQEYRSWARVWDGAAEEEPVDDTSETTDALATVTLNAESPDDDRSEESAMDGLPQETIPFPSQLGSSGLPPEGLHRFPSSILRDRPRAISEAPSRGTQVGDPYRTYARRASLIGVPSVVQGGSQLQPPRLPYTPVRSPLPLDVTPGTGPSSPRQRTISYVIPARNRNISTTGDEYRPTMLRQLSTLSVNEMSGALAPLPGIPADAVAGDVAAQVKEAGANAGVAQADAPASSMPMEFSADGRRRGRSNEILG